MVFAIPAEQREDVVRRMDDHLAAIGFHCIGQTFTNTRAKAEEIEQRAFSAADVASTTTTGDRPLLESMRLYAKKAAELLKEEAEREGDNTTATEAGPQDSDVSYPPPLHCLLY